MRLEKRTMPWAAGVSLIPALSLVLVTSLPAAAHQQASLVQSQQEETVVQSSSPVSIVDGHITDSALGYSFGVHTGWLLDSKSVPGNLTLIHEPSGSRFSVQVKENASDPEAEFKGLKMAAPFLGGKWSKVGERWTKIGKVRAGELESTRSHADGSTWHEWNLVCVKKSRAFLLWLSVPDGQTKGRADLDQFVGSFEWTKK